MEARPGPACMAEWGGRRQRGFRAVGVWTSGTLGRGHANTRRSRRQNRAQDEGWRESNNNSSSNNNQNKTKKGKIFSPRSVADMVLVAGFDPLMSTVALAREKGWGHGGGGVRVREGDPAWCLVMMDSGIMIVMYRLAGGRLLSGRGVQGAQLCMHSIDRD